MKIKMISSEDKEEWLKETYDYLQKKLKEDKYGDVRLDYIMLYELHKEEHKEIERLNNVINELEKWLEEKQILYGINQQGFSWGVCGEALDKLKALKEGK